MGAQRGRGAGAEVKPRRDEERNHRPGLRRERPLGLAALLLEDPASASDYFSFFSSPQS